MKKFPEKVQRSDFRHLEKRARNAIQRKVRGVCLCMARDILRLGVKIDAYPMELFPVFEMIDKKVKEENCVVYSGEYGYQLCRYNGEVLSQGTTMREWLIDHVSRFGDVIAGPEDYSID